MKILNLYAGIGGNRKLWGDKHSITAVERDSAIASVYSDLFPNDNMVIDDAHKYLLNNYMNYDFIWSSPPCPSHSRINTDGQRKARYPQMVLYEEIIMLGNNWFRGKWVVENVIPYYKPLIVPTAKLDRHLFWSNFLIQSVVTKKEKPIKDQTGTNGRYGFNLLGVDVCGRDKRQILRNLVNPKIGKSILKNAQNIHIIENLPQENMF